MLKNIILKKYISYVKNCVKFNIDMLVLYNFVSNPSTAKSKNCAISTVFCTFYITCTDFFLKSCKRKSLQDNNNYYYYYFESSVILKQLNNAPVLFFPSQLPAALNSSCLISWQQKIPFFTPTQRPAVASYAKTFS